MYDELKNRCLVGDITSRERCEKEKASSAAFAFLTNRCVLRVFVFETALGKIF